jgi:hypothetical protein
MWGNGLRLDARCDAEFGCGNRRGGQALMRVQERRPEPMGQRSLVKLTHGQGPPEP